MTDQIDTLFALIESNQDDPVFFSAIADALDEAGYPGVSLLWAAEYQRMPVYYPTWRQWRWYVFDNYDFANITNLMIYSGHRDVLPGLVMSPARRYSLLEFPTLVSAWRWYVENFNPDWSENERSEENN